MALAAIDEAIRNVIAVGADPDKVAILDNFCWPSVDDERMMGTLVRACEACRDAALAYGIPFISGKDSLHNQFTNSETGHVIRIPNTLLISAIGVIEDVRKCVTMDLKSAGNHLYLVQPRLGADGLTERAAVHRAVSKAIRGGHVVSAHDVSNGGLAVAAAEMAIAADLGVTIDSPDHIPELFTERPGCYLIELAGPARPDALAGRLFDVVDVRYIGIVGGETLKVRGNGEDRIDLADLRQAWRGTLDW
jgi:phosphoribosylformylglycinamidine synthase